MSRVSVKRLVSVRGAEAGEVGDVRQVQDRKRCIKRPVEGWAHSSQGRLRYVLVTRSPALR